jgi:hypothetical protein
MDVDTDDGQQAGEQGRAPDAALLRLQFSRAVMVLFEQSGVKEGALAFARAALRVADEAYAGDQGQRKLQQQGACGVCDEAGWCGVCALEHGHPPGNLVSNPCACLMVVLRALRPRCCLPPPLLPAAFNISNAAALWSNIFNYAFDLGQVQDAYAAALSNPQHDTAERDLRRLVLALVESGGRWLAGA